MKYAAVATIKVGKGCTFLVAEGPATAALLFSGKPVATQQAAKMRELLARAEQPLFGQEICPRHLPEADESLIGGEPWTIPSTRTRSSSGFHPKSEDVNWP